MDTTTMQLITPTGALVAPNGNAEIADALCAYIHQRKDALATEIRAVEVTADNWNGETMKAMLKAIKDAIEDLRERGKRLVADVCAASDAQRVLSQIDSRLWSFKAKADPLCAYEVLTEAYGKLKAKVDAFKAAATPPKPKHTYVVKVTCDDDALAAIAKAAQKAGAEEFFYAAAQSDKAVKQIAKWFEENA